MALQLKVLIVEDSADDAELLLHALSKAGYSPIHSRVVNAEQMRRELQKQPWDLVVSDYVLPSFSGLDALKLLQETGLEIPFIIVSGKIGEEVAVEALKAGANDYLLKDRLTRLGPAIDRALKEAAQKRKRRQAEAALRESEERYRRLVESCPEPMFISADGKFVYLNPAAVNLFGARSPVELVGKAVLELVEATYRDLVEEYFRLSLAGLDGPLLEQRILRLDGTPVLVEAIARHIHYHGEDAVQILCRDVSARKQLETQLLNTQKMEAIGRLAGGVANDFNNLLTVITGYTGLIRSGLGPDHPLQRDLQHISQSTERAITLTNQLLALSRKEVASPQALDLNNVIEQTMPLIRRLMGEKIDCVANLGGDLHLVRADRGQMETVVINLIVHARDSMPEGGKLVIETDNYQVKKRDGSPQMELKPGEYVVLSIDDTGRGLSDEYREHLFEPFFTSGEVGRNTGLGLATVYAIIKQHRGHIWCASELGKGSSFRIYLPRFAPSPKPTPLPKTGPVNGAAGQIIMVVEDEDILRDFAQLVLRRNGYNVLPARNGEEALKLLDETPNPVDLVFTDVVMPRMSGADLFRRVNQAYPSIPVLFTSGYPRTILLEAGIQDNTFEFLQKPYTTQGLIEKIRELLGNKEPT
jgi:two-component system cell cycle sensor histidine kinase/response regulator CckA